MPIEERKYSILFSWHHILEVVWNGVILFIAITVILTPLLWHAAKRNTRLFNWLSPYTKGGVGNLPTPEGRLHERLAPPSHHK